MVKNHAKKITEFEKKLVDLVDYKNKKMVEERGIKLKQRKEIKKVKQMAIKVEASDPADTFSSDVFPKNDFNFNVLVSNSFDALNHIEEKLGSELS